MELGRGGILCHRPAPCRLPGDIEHPGGSQGQYGLCRGSSQTCQPQLLRHPNQGTAKAQEAMASASGLAALAALAAWTHLSLSTQPGEAFLSHSGDSTIRAPPGSRLGRSLAALFPLALESFAGRSGVWDRRWGPHGTTGTVALLQPQLPRVPWESLPFLWAVPVGLCPPPHLGGGLLSTLPLQRKLVLRGVTPFLPLPRSHSEFLS